MLESIISCLLIYYSFCSDFTGVLNKLLVIFKLCLFFPFLDFDEELED